MSRASSAIRTGGFIAALALAAGLAGCSQGANDVTDPGPGTATEEGAQPNGAAPDQSGTDNNSHPAGDADLRTTDLPIAATDAVNIANDAVDAGFVYKIELDYDKRDAAWEWEINILDGTTEHEIEIDAVSGEIVSQKQEETDDTEQPVDLTDPMTYDKALELAVAKIDGPLRGWKLEWDDGRREYQFDLVRDNTEFEVSVDVESGAVTLDD